MIEYKIKTRHSGSPQGKARVFFTCHPDDKTNLLDRICDEILDASDVAIYYTDGEMKDPELEAHLFDIGQARLLVVAVTEKLIEDDTVAALEMSAALEKHVPVLPIMCDGGLERRFSRKFGNLQLLSMDVSDETALSYKGKLKAFLDSVIFGDELVKKIRAAFDAYVFLSYRKTDRKYARELMELIHSNELCRDIAIWYDEFLVPGENFDSAIEGMLKKSDLFALVVTPNLVSESNYVMNVEYPMAIEQKKPIISVEFEKTDREALSDRYESISVVSATDGVGECFAERIKSLAVTEDDSSPEHCFFIGLAYLGGVDVEVNFERALSLITYAAENGVTEAIQKLVSMYLNGDGVSRDFAKCIEWQEKLIECLYKRLEIEDTVALRCRLIVEREELWSLKGELGVSREETIYDVLNSAETWLGDSDSRDALYLLTYMYKSVALYCFISSERREIILKAVRTGEKLACAYDCDEARMLLIEVYDCAADIMGDEEYGYKALKLLESIEESDGMPVYMTSSDVYRTLSYLYSDKKMPEEARTCAKLSLEKARLSEEGTTVAYSCLEVATLCINIGDRLGAEKAYLEGITSVIGVSENKRSRYDISVLKRLYEGISELYGEEIGDYELEYLYSVKAEQTHELLVRDYPFRDNINEAESYTLNRGSDYFLRGEYERAIWFLKKHIELHIALVDRKRYKEFPAYALLDIGRAYFELGDAGAVKENLLSFLQIVEKEAPLRCDNGLSLTETDLTDVFVTDLLALSCYRYVTGYGEPYNCELLQIAYDGWNALEGRYPERGYGDKRDAVEELLKKCDS